MNMKINILNEVNYKFRGGVHDSHIGPLATNIQLSTTPADSPVGPQSNLDTPCKTGQSAILYLGWTSASIKFHQNQL
jgi:hypothetical protein